MYNNALVSLLSAIGRFFDPSNPCRNTGRSPRLAKLFDGSTLHMNTYVQSRRRSDFRSSIIPSSLPVSGRIRASLFFEFSILNRTVFPLRSTSRHSSLTDSLFRQPLRYRNSTKGLRWSGRLLRSLKKSRGIPGARYFQSALEPRFTR